MAELQSPTQTLTVLDENATNVVALKVQERLSTFEQGFSENTNRARAADFKIYKKWCEEENINPVPASPENIERFLWDSVQEQKVDEKTGELVFTPKSGKPSYKQIRSVVTVERYLSTIKYLHDISFEVYLEMSGEDSFNPERYRNPVDSKRVRITLKAIKRRYRSKAQRQAAPIRLNLVETILTTLDDSLRYTLYKTLVSVGFDTMMRCSELVAIELEQISYHDDGSASVYVPFHKSDQEGEGGYRYLSAVSVTLIHNWLTLAHIEDGLLFRSIGKGDVMLDKMHKDRVSRIYKIIARLCDVNVADISAHSTRVGAAQELLSNGVTMPALMVAGDWKSPAMPVRYAKKISVATGAMAELAKSRGRS